ncbi:MAG: ring-cleaving dioxygenase [Nitrososphaerales archaeon]|jgi:catechol 2,3-dioxygenase-like lactoylglutathione lyase family enzyme
MAEILGIHHVTAIAGEPQQNVDFYAGLMGLRLVKLTVNYDDPETYHLYFGDELGHPGTILTFFPWPGAPRGVKGTGQATTTSFSIPLGSVGYWAERLRGAGVRLEGPFVRFGDRAISFTDPDGLNLELVEQPPGAETRRGWDRGPVPQEHSIRGLFGVTLSEEGYERTASLVVETLGFRPVGQEADRFRYQVGGGGGGAPGATVDVLCQPEAQAGFVGVGTVHHVAWRTPTDEAQREWRRELVKRRMNVTPVIDRRYFRSIYFREPGGVLFEIATDPPGFTVDESADELGTRLMLLPQLEEMRTALVEALPRLELPKGSSAKAGWRQSSS